MLEHECNMLNPYIPIEYQHIDSGICINLRRKILTFSMIDYKHPMTLQYFKSSNLRRQEQIRHVSNHPFMIHPFSRLTLYWEFLYLIVYTIVTLIIGVTLMDTEHIITKYLLLLKRFLDMFLIVDIVKHFITGYYYKEENGTIMNPRFLVKLYLKSYFLLDFLPLMPTIFTAIGNVVKDKELVKKIYEILKFFNILRISRLPRCCEALTLWRKYSKVSTNVSGMGTVIYKYVIIIIWLYGVVLYADNFVDMYVVIRSSRTISIGKLDSFLSFTRLLLHTSYSLDYAKHPVDHAASIFFIGLAYGLYLYLHCKIFQAYRRFTKARSQNDTLLGEFKAYVEYTALPVSLRKTFINFFQFRYQNEFFNEVRLNEILSNNLREQIQIQVSKHHIKKVEFLKDLPQHVLTQLVARMKTEIYLANDTILVAGVPGNCMYFLYYGTVAVYTPSGKELCHLEDGAHFGEIALILNESRVATVVAVTPCELFVLKRADFNDVINVYPNFKRKIFEMAHNRLSASQTDLR